MKKRFLFFALPIMAIMQFSSCGDDSEDVDSTPKDEQNEPQYELVAPDVNGQEYVDLGLPSGTFWATMNLGATSIEDYRNVFSWGETTTKKVWDDTNYIFYKNEAIKGYTKYITEADGNEMGYQGFFDNKIVLDLEDDAAHVMMGGSWRMPTKEDWDELLANCQCTWEKYKNINGCKFTGKDNAWIFLPAAGSGGFSGHLYQGEDGSYWASSLYTAYSDMVWRVYFASDYECNVINAWRGYGFSVRGVCSPIKVKK